MVNSLEERFKQFLRSFPGAEEIDALRLSDHSTYSRKADFLIENRKVVVELKTLSANPVDKVGDEVDKHRVRSDFPLVYGEVDLRKVLAHLPDGEAIRRRILNKIGRSIEEGVRSAEEQIEHTRRRLEIPDAVGVLVLLNESISILDPQVVAHRVSGTSRRPRSGRNEWPPVDFCLIVDESNLMHIDGHPSAFVNIWVPNRASSDLPWFEPIRDSLTKEWSRFNHMPHMDGERANPQKLIFTPTGKAGEQPPKTIRQQDLWSMQYANNPYLRPMTDEQLLDYGGRTIAGNAPAFLVRGPKVSAAEMRCMMEKWTHFIDEMRYRGLDWKRIPKYPIQGLGEA